MFMVFCSNCGKDLLEDAYFCPKCGARTIKGVEAGVSTPLEEIVDAFSKMGQEIEKAFSIAAKEVQKGFKTAKGNIQQSIGTAPIVCPHCGENNPSRTNFCYKCGKSLTK